MTVWRKALGVEPTTQGTSRLRSAWAHEPGAQAARRKAQRQARDPVKDAPRRAKIAESKRGKPRPPHVIEAIRQIHLGKHLSEETRSKMSESHKARGQTPGQRDSDGRVAPRSLTSLDNE